METYTVKIPYDIVRVHNDGIPEVLSKAEIKDLKAGIDLRQLLQEASLDAYRLFNGYAKKEKKYYEMCWGINCVTNVKLQYYMSGDAKLTVAVTHALTADEYSLFRNHVSSQMIDGYGGTPIKLCRYKGYTYSIEI
jgi:hypothetical protein